MSAAGQLVPPLVRLAFDRPGSAQIRQANRLAHLKWAQEQPWIRLGGPLLDPSTEDERDQTVIGSFLSLQRGFVEQLATDPYLQADLFEKSHQYIWRVSVGSFSTFSEDSIGTAPSRPERFYLVWGLDKPDALSRRLTHREQHLAWLRASGDRCMVAGALIPETGTTETTVEQGKPCGTILIVRGFDVVNSVHSWLAQDPYTEANVFDHVQVFGFQPVIRRGEN
jgi:uncharacterized protein YciI